ncbi:mechanosensitive ion channel [Porphyromonas gingivalis]|nr:mechanosensitive ion channel [Porphyromonas gingivalis]
MPADSVSAGLSASINDIKVTNSMGLKILFPLQNLSVDTTKVNKIAEVVSPEALKQIKEIKPSQWTELLTQWGGKALTFGIKVVIAIVAFYLGKLLLNALVKWLDRIMVRRSFEPAARTFLRSFANIGGFVLLIVIIISTLGFQPVSLAALLASVGVAVGMGLSGQLQNLAGGLIVLLTKPFKVGDYIVSNNVEGVVDGVTLFHTTVMTFENKYIFIPNGLLSSNVIINYSRMAVRRNEWIIGIEYNEDFDRVKTLLLRLIDEEPRIIKDPLPTVVLKELADSSVRVMARAWCATDDLWNVYWDINERIYSEFNRQGIAFPFPQLTIHGSAAGQERRGKSTEAQSPENVSTNTSL